MPGRSSRKQDPFHRIHKWDDGYEYIKDKTPTPPDGRDSVPFFSPPLPPKYGYEPEPVARARPGRGYDEEPPYPRRSYPSPPSSDGYARRRRRSSPPPYRASRSPSPPPTRHRDNNPRGHPPQSSWQRPPQPSQPRRQPSLDSLDYPPSRLNRSRSTREPHRPPPPNGYPRPPSPDPTLRRHHDRRRRSPSPLPRSSRRHRPPSPVHRGRAPPSRDFDRGAGRPPLTRAKSTPAKDGFAGLSPRWQQAAMAAFQAGSMAAINMRSQPGGWSKEKGARVASAALGAAAMDAFRKQDSGGGGGSGKKKAAGGGRSRRNSAVGSIGGALGGFLVDQLTKGSSKRR